MPESNLFEAFLDDWDKHVHSYDPTSYSPHFHDNLLPLQPLPVSGQNHTQHFWAMSAVLSTLQENRALLWEHLTPEERHYVNYWIMSQIDTNVFSSGTSRQGGGA